MNAHWTAFLERVPWFDASGAKAGPLMPPGAWRPHAETFAGLFPQLDRLLAASSVSVVMAGGRHYRLHSWLLAGGSIAAWLSPPPVREPPPWLFAHHRTLLASFGGIVERSNDPDPSWLDNHTAVLTLAEAQRDASFLAEYSWAFDKSPEGIPIDTQAFYSIAREANGNPTLCDRASGEVLLFAPDHAFAHVDPLEGCPDYTLYRIRGGATFAEWIEAVAGQWSKPLAGA